MVGVGVLVSASVMCVVGSYFLFQLSRREKENGITHDALQVVFFFMVISSMILLGRAGYDDRLDCSYVYDNITASSNGNVYGYSYQCNDPGTNGYIWLYKLPLWLAEISGLYLIIYYLLMVSKWIKSRRRDRE